MASVADAIRHGAQGGGDGGGGASGGDGGGGGAEGGAPPAHPPPAPTTIVDLPSLLGGGRDACIELKACLEARGFAFVRLTTDVTGLAFDTLERFSQWLAERDDAEKRSFAYPPGFGYQANADKQAFRVLTGKHCTQAVLPPALAKAVSGTSTVLDTLCIQLCRAAGPAVFGASTEAIAARCDLPLLDPDAARVSYGMLDVVEYRNRDGGAAVAAGDGAYNVAAHADPGLFALSVLSTEPGLKLYDPGTDAWFALEGLGGGAGGGGPDGVGVLWAGAAATEASGGRVKAGVHRVDTGGRPRATLWYEVCTRQQVPTRIRATGLHRQESLREPDDAAPGGGGGGGGGGGAEAKPITIFVKTLTGKTITITHLTPADSVMAFFFVLQDREGLPPAKTRAMAHGKVLLQDDTIPLSAYGIGDRSVLHLILGLRRTRLPKDPKLQAARMRAELAGGGPADLAAAEAALATSGMALESRLRGNVKQWRCVKCGGTTRVDDATGKNDTRVGSCFGCGAWTCCACGFVNEQGEAQCQMCRDDPYMQRMKEMEAAANQPGAAEKKKKKKAKKPSRGIMSFFKPKKQHYDAGAARAATAASAEAAAKTKARNQGRTNLWVSWGNNTVQLKK